MQSTTIITTNDDTINYIKCIEVQCGILINNPDDMSFRRISKYISTGNRIAKQKKEHIKVEL